MMKYILSVVFSLFLFVATSAYAAPLAIDGFDSCDVANETTITGTGWSSVAASSPNRCKAQLVLPSGAASYLTQTYSATQTPQAYTRITWTGGSGTRALLGLGTSVDGCLVQIDSNTGELVLRYGNYSEIGRTALASGVETGVGLAQSNGSGGSCSNACVVSCGLYVNGARKLSDSYSSIAGADYTVPTMTWIGSRNANPGTYTVTFDPLLTEDQVTTIIGAARLVPLFPDGDGSPTQWNNSCASSKFECVDDYNDSASGADDGATTTLRETSSGNKTTVTLTSATIGAGETLASVMSFGVAREVSDDARDWRLNQTDGDGNADGSPAANGPTESPGAAFVVSSRLLRTVAPGGGAWSQSALDSLTLQAEHRTNTGNIDVTALLAYADIRTPAPPERQNLQDWNGDGGFTGACFGDSTTLGTGFGTCELNASAGYAPSDIPGGTDLPGRCTQSSHCFTCSNAITTPCNSDSNCSGGGVCTNFGPCTSTGRWCTSAAAALTQTVGTRTTTWLNAGIGGNTLYALLQRVGTLTSGSSQVTNRYCLINGNVACTPDNTGSVNTCIGGSNAGATCSSGNDSICPGGICVKPCGTAPLCQSAACGTSKTAYCALSANLATGGRVCSGSHSTPCATNADCTGVGTCSDYPGPDLVYVAIGGNDLRIYPSDQRCNLGSLPFVPPCPPQATVASGAPTPVTTPTPGAKSCQRVSCTGNTECAGASAGLCSNDFTKGCDSNGDCSPGTCLTSLSRNGTGSVCSQGSCSISTTKGCATDATCPRGETCNTGAKFCSCPCAAVPCAIDSDCQMGGFDPTGTGTIATWTPKCVSGKCQGCGQPASRKVCSGDHHQQCWRDSDCALFGGTCSEENPRYWEARRTISAAKWLDQAKALKAAIEASGARVIWLTYFPFNQDPTFPDLSVWWEARDELLLTRKHILDGELGENAVDIYGLLNRADERITRYRCVKSPSVRCGANADCPNSGECADFNRSTLRAKGDPIHQNLLGASYTGRFVSDYTKQLSPVCSGDKTTGCGRCSGHCAGGSNANALCSTSSQCPGSSCDTGTACLGSDTCGGFLNGEKCLKNDSVCSPSKGTCSDMRACFSTSNCTDHSLCTWDLTAKCQSDSDCVGKGACRPEGLPLSGES